MAQPEESQRLGVAQSQENRAHPRRKLAPMAYVELGQDNGGILLNLGEGGFAVQSALALTSRDFPSLRFQVPHAQGWLSATGKIAWISESKKEAGIQFTELPSVSRSEIRKWVASDDLQESDNRGTPPPTRDAKADIFNAPASRVAPPTSAPTRTNGASTRPRPTITARAPLPTPSEQPPVTAAEANPPEFHFTDYSMFAADPVHEQDRVWIGSEKKGMGWGALTLLALLLSALFFVLGATVGRGTVEQWMAQITGSSARQTPPAPEATASARSDQNPSDVQQSSPQSSQPAEAHSESPGTENGSATSDAASAPPPDKQPPQSESLKVQDQSRTATEHAAQDSAVSSRKDRLSKNSAPSQKVEERSYPQAAPPRSYDDINASSVTNTGDHAILVNAPAPGSPPFFVNLPSDPVSASSSVAISAQRSIAIAPRAGSYGRAQRVVIGKLISHSDPFYPGEARSKRVQGSVVLHVIIGRTGHIIGVTPVRGPTELMNASIAAVREWRYEPTYVDGDPAETQADVTLVFRLP